MLAQLIEIELRQSLSPVQRRPDQTGHDSMGLAERKTAPDQQIGHVGGGQELIAGRACYNPLLPSG